MTIIAESYTLASSRLYLESGDVKWNVVNSPKSIGVIEEPLRRDCNRS